MPPEFHHTHSSTLSNLFWTSIISKQKFGAKTAEQCEPLSQGATNPTRTNITLYFILDGNRKLLFKGKIFVIKNSGTSLPARENKSS